MGLFKDLKVLKALSLSWVSEQFESATAVASTAGYCWFTEIRMHLNIFQRGLSLLFKCIHVVTNKKAAYKKEILYPSEINRSSSPRSGVFGIQNWFREELKQPLTEHKIYSEAFLEQDLTDCSCSDFAVVFVPSRLTKLTPWNSTLKCKWPQSLPV